MSSASSSEMEVQIISKQNVKPTCPTPSHLKNYKLSLLDHLIPSPYAPIILFYQNNNNNNNNNGGNLDVLERLELLKESLSETLTHFYPLAGKIKDDLSIECNDEGANFVEATVNCDLNEFLRKPDLLLIQKFLPCELVMKESSAGSYVTNIQANVFACGGIAIGICISHKILDGAALGTFLKGWSSATKCCNEVICPKFIASNLFPCNDLWLRDCAMVMWGSMFRKGECITKRFVFDASSVSNLKAEATSFSSLKSSSTRVEVVSALLWKCTMAASEQLCGSKKPSLLTHLVNLRRRMKPVLSENSIGNLLWIAVANHATSDSSKQELSALADKVKQSITKIDDNFITRMKSYEGNSMMSESMKEITAPDAKDGVEYLGFSSWCKLGFYDTDFGWGKPAWVSSFGLAGSVFMNLIILVDTRLGDGIEAWVTLDEQEMAILESNTELLRFASIDPSPLLIDKS